MDAETVFLVLGLGLTALALIISFIGLRLETFPPSRPVMLAGIGLFAAVVAGVAAFGWMGSEDEQEHRNELIAAGEEPSPADVVAEMEAAAAEQIAADEGQDAPAQEATDQTAAADGAALFESEGCGGCHTLEAAGATGTTGPDLDTTLVDQDVAFIEESIVDPEAEIADGFPAGVMPDNYGDVLSPEELEALVAYLAESVGAQQ